MEALQAYTYSVINQCALPSNQVATLLGYLHIAFQPFFANMVGMYFIPAKVKEKISIFVFTACACAALIFLIQIYPFEWAGLCEVGHMLCGKKLCSVSGNWHIAWDVPTNNLSWNIFGLTSEWRYSSIAYGTTVFLMPILYGSWRMTLYHIMLGPVLAVLSTGNVNEQAAVWCLLSIGLLLIVVKTRIRTFLYVKSWFLWPRSWTLVKS